MFRITKKMFADVALESDVKLFAEIWPDGFEINEENFGKAVDHELGEDLMKLLIAGSPAHSRWIKDECQPIELAVDVLNELYKDCRNDVDEDRPELLVNETLIECFPGDDAIVKGLSATGPENVYRHFVWDTELECWSLNKMLTRAEFLAKF